MPKMLEGKKVIVTGASKGIGKAIAILFAKEGAIVGLNYYKSQEKAQKVLEKIQKYSEGILLQGDVAHEKDSQKIVSQFVEKYGGIDILVNNAGIYRRKDLENSEIEDYDRTMQVNMRGTFLMSKLSLPYLKKSKAGRIINLSSQLAFKGSTHGTAYVTSKTAIIGFTRALALELAPQRITVNAIAPGTIETDIIAGYSEDQKKIRAQEIPLKRIGQPIDIANAALYLASEMGSYVTGEILGVNGGSELH